jgi:hypothetical protein
MMSSLTNCIRLAVFAVSILVVSAAPAQAYDPKITPKDVVDAGGYCRGERCYLNGKAFHCVNNRCWAT